MVDSVFVIQHRDGSFLSRQHEWVNASEPQAVFRTPHRDLAVNELFELTARHTELRARVVQVQTNARGLPMLHVVAPPDFPGLRAPVRNQPATSDTTDPAGCGANATAGLEP